MRLLAYFLEGGVARLATCAAHGLHFDSTKSTGCVLCRKNSAAPGAIRTPKLLYALVALLALVVAAIVSRVLGSPKPPATHERSAPAATIVDTHPSAQHDPEGALTKQAQLNPDPALVRPSGAGSNRDTHDWQALPKEPSGPGRVSRLENELPAMTTEMLEQACKAGNFDGCPFLAKRLLSTPPL